jgi:hypothetical protein
MDIDIEIVLRRERSLIPQAIKLVLDDGELSTEEHFPGQKPNAETGLNGQQN